MAIAKYCLGIDFGTLSGRAVLVEVKTGNIIAVSVKNYSHAVMDEYLPDGKTKLPPDWALQHPADYLEVLETTIPAVIKDSGVHPCNVIGISVDFTASTMIPLDKNYMPLCLNREFSSNPHSYAKLWKHHAAQYQANKLNNIALERREPFLDRYGGKISSEWLIPKIMQVLEEAPEIYNATHKFMEAADWITYILTGKEVRGTCAAGYKAIWSKRDGYPSNLFFKALDPRLEYLVDEKLSRNICPMASKAGELTEEVARKIGLIPGTAVGVPIVDAHAGVPGVGIVQPGKMMMIMGTSTCHMVLGTGEKAIPGICGAVEDGVIPGFVCYEAGQSCAGDHFDWFVKNCVPQDYMEEVKSKRIDTHTLLSEKAEKLKVGESGLLALDWWNGNRSVLSDTDLTGIIVGCTLSTKPEEIYRALIEATAFGTKIIIENFETHGVITNEIYACGGMAGKNKFLMQIYADVTNREINISASPQTAALGAAMYAAVAAGKKQGGYDSIISAAKNMAKLKDECYKPIPENTKIYNKLYEDYKTLYNYFGRGSNDVMKRLKRLKAEAIQLRF
jgi:L-ribulokinase